MSTHNLYRLALTQARDAFARYAKSHRAKIGTKFEEGTPGAADTSIKAEANENLTAYMNAALELPIAEVDHQLMVHNLQKPGEAILAQMTPLKIMCLHMVGGAASEGGELFDAIKRWALFGKELDRENVVEELGDLEFFMEGLRQNLGISRDDTLEQNMTKLVKGDRPRYAGGVFSDAATIARADKAEPTGLYVSEEAADVEFIRLADEKHATQMADLTPEEDR